MSSSLQLTYHNICTFLFNIYCTYLSITLYTLPKSKKEVSGILVLEQQINLINKDEGISAFRPVLRNAV